MEAQSSQLLQQETVQVQLAIYDLSQGMARSLSAQFLGPNHAIDVIPHTGILVFGKEYYFGGNGIESSDPHHFRSTRGLVPMGVMNLGTTRVSQSQFEAWCRTQSHSSAGPGLYSNTSYDLFHRNCNNFSQHAVTEGLSLADASVPAWVMDVPRRVLASPMGQLIRPLMEQMQITGPTGGAGGAVNFSNDANPWASNSTSTSTSSSTTRVDNTATIHSSHDNLTNPWADLPSTSTTTSPPANARMNIPSQSTVRSTAAATTTTTTTTTAATTITASKYSQEEEERIMHVLLFFMSMYQAQQDQLR